MTPEQENALLKLVANDLKHPLFAYVNDLIAQARADERAKLLAKMSRQRRELRRLNKYLGPYWAGFRKGMEMEGETKLRGIMNAAFGHAAVHEAEAAAIRARKDSNE